MIDGIQVARDRRESLLTAETNAWRLVDGEGDGLTDLYLEDFAGRLLLSTTRELSPPLKSWARNQPDTLYWKRLDQHQKDAPLHLGGKIQEEPFPILENDTQFLVNFQSGYSQGIFLDQRDNRRRIRERCGVGDTILNTFAYTGAFSICAAMAGATTTTLDLSQPYLDWARDNFRLNDIDPESQHFCKGDTFHWLRRFARQGRQFQGIILDPPTFSRDQDGKVFRAEENYGDLVSLAARCLVRSGWLLCTTNCRRLSHADFKRTVLKALPKASRINSYPMPSDFTGEPYLKSLLVIT